MVRVHKPCQGRLGPTFRQKCPIGDALPFVGPEPSRRVPGTDRCCTVSAWPRPAPRRGLMPHFFCPKRPLLCLGDLGDLRSGSASSSPQGVSALSPRSLRSPRLDPPRESKAPRRGLMRQEGFGASTSSGSPRACPSDYARGYPRRPYGASARCRGLRPAGRNHARGDSREPRKTRAPPAGLKSRHRPAQARAKRRPGCRRYCAVEPRRGVIDAPIPPFQGVRREKV